MPTRQQPSNAARRAGCRHQLLRLLALLRWRPGRAAPRHRVEGQRDDVIVGTKAGRYRFDEFDFSPRRIRDGLHRSLELLKTDYVDILQLHDIEFVFLDGVFADAYGKLVRLRDEGKCRFIGMTGYPLHTIRRAISETDLDVVLNYAHFTLLNTVAHRPLVADPQANGTAVINAAAVALGPLTPAGLKANVPASDALVAASRRANEICAAHGADLAFLVPPRPRRPR